MELDGSNNEDLDILQSTGPEMVIPKEKQRNHFLSQNTYDQIFFIKQSMFLFPNFLN